MHHQRLTDQHEPVMTSYCAAKNVCLLFVLCIVYSRGRYVFFIYGDTHSFHEATFQSVHILNGWLHVGSQVSIPPNPVHTRVQCVMHGVLNKTNIS